jgi:hypothetical protein
MRADTESSAPVDSKMVAAQWHTGCERVRVYVAETTADCHVVKIALRNVPSRDSFNEARE